ncbi:MAG: DegT/DnrJ/EryC1/StrS family aminotransferase [Chloroflexi bacterium]|nr:DegT/DnrJ/EryC1/StrS family aminotransferase [Chloroflexota bacterium]
MTERRDIPFARPWITDEDRAAVARVLGGHILTHGPEGKAFEDEFARSLGPGAHCVSVSSCMAALHLASLAFGLGPGDEVILPAMTHVAAAHAVEWVGATPVFVDCDLRTGNVTAGALEGAITPRTKALSLVHYAGIPCDMHPIVALAERHGLRVIEDAAIALGARIDGTHVGLIGDIGCFSFYPVKHITTGEGGMVASRHPEIAERIGRIRAFGVDRTHAERSTPGLYDVPVLGLNYRMSEMQAALGRSQLTRLDRILTVRANNFARLAGHLSRVRGVRVVDTDAPTRSNSHYVLTVVVEDAGIERNELIRKLNADGVGTSIYYPQPVPRMAFYREKYGYDGARFPNAAFISDRSIALPIGPHIGRDELDYVAERFERAVAA